jgi:cell division protein FtsN
MPAASTKNDQTPLPENRKKSHPAPSVKADANLRYVSPSQQEERSRVVGSKYMIQAISTSDNEDAGAARKKLMAEGFPAGIFEADLGARGKWYRVYVGPYGSDEEAQQAVKAVHRIPGFEASFVKSLD